MTFKRVSPGEALALVRGGFTGQHDPFGRAEPGWLELGLPTSREALAGRSWDELRARS